MFTRICSIAACALVLAGAAWAQTQPAPERQPAPGPSPYGNGEQLLLRYSDDAAPRNTLLFSLRQNTAYDDNVLNNNALRVADVAFELGAHFGFQQQRKKFSFALDYSPGAVMYREQSSQNALNHGLQFDAQYELHPRFTLRLRESAAYRTGILFPAAGEDFASRLGPPAVSNSSLYTPLTRQFETTSRADLIYQKSYRTSFSVFSGYNLRDFRRGAATQAPLADQQGVSGGFQYSYRVRRSTTLAGVYVFQNLHIGDSRARIHGMYASAARVLSPRLRVDVWGGPQYAQLRDHFTLDVMLFGMPLQLVGDSRRERWNAAGGGSLAVSSERTALLLRGERTVTDGGGLLASAAVNESFSVSLRQRIQRQWHGAWNLSLARTSLIDSPVGNGSIRLFNSGVSLERSLTEQITARATYNFVQQVSRGNVPFAAGIDRNRVSLGLAWQVAKHGFGR